MIFQENFNVDECLSNCTNKGDLETLRRELKNYGTDLQHQMADILKTETEAIVNLAEYLTNLENKIENLQQPVCQLREEILVSNYKFHVKHCLKSVYFQSLYTLTNNAEKSYDSHLRNMKKNNTNQTNVQLKQEILASSFYIENLLRSSGENAYDLVAIEHLVNKFSFQKYYMEVLDIISPEIQEIIDKVEKKLIEIINNNFLQSFRTKNLDLLQRCLRLYCNLGKQGIGYDTFRTHIIKPYLERVLNEKNLEKCNQDLDKIYEDVLAFITKEVDVINKIIEDNEDLKSYNFMLHSFWKEFDRQSRLGLPYITAPGNPELFRKRFRSSFNTLEKIAFKCGNANLIRYDETFQEHLKRFNLPVYFEIEYQKIASEFESEILVEKDKISASNNYLHCKFKPTLALYMGVSQCFNEDVYIDQLSDQFLKLSLMLLSRYLKWFEQHLQVGYFILIIRYVQIIHLYSIII